MKITLGFLIAFDITVLLILIYGIYLSIKVGGGSVALPGLGFEFFLPGLLFIILMIELGLIGLKFLVYRSIIADSMELK